MRLFLRFAVILVALAALNVPATPPAGYYLVWGDEFNGTSLDTTKWWVWNQPDRSGYSTPNAVTEGGGYMTIHTYTTNGANFSAIVSSDPVFRERYGYTEASIEFNGSPGMFSDFWMNSAVNGDYLGNPAAEGAEVDFCEHRATDANDADNISGMVTIDVHWDGYTSGVEKTATSGLIGSGLGTGFHTYGCLWNSTNYSVSFDGVPVWSTSSGISAHTEVIMLSSEVDSNSFCGIVPAGGYGNFLVSTTSTVVDYLRFYAPTTTVYWIGTSSANWADGGNWLSNMIPTSASDVVFSYLSLGNYSINLGQNTTVNSLSIQETPSIAINGNTLTVNAGGIDMLSALNNATINSALVLNAAQAWSVGAGITLTVNNTVSGTGGLTLTGLGAVALQATDNSSGPTTISNGTLLVYGVLSNQVTVAGGTLSGTGTVVGPVSINSGTVSGTETITGPVVINAYGALSPGSPTGALTISNSLTLQPGSTTSININKSTGACGQVIGLTSITYGGTLIVNNQAGVLAPGDSFQLFNAGSYSGAFNRITPSTPGNGLAWDTGDLDATGILRVITTTNALITAQLTGLQLSLSWPLNNTGWYLQTQTNAPGVGITTNWITVPGSNVTNLMNLTIDPSVGSVYYRLGSPTFSTAVFASGDLIVLQIGNGSIASTGAPGVLIDYSPFGGPSQAQIALPTSGSHSLIFGNLVLDGVLSLSADGRTVVVAGFNVPLGSYGSTINGSSTSGSSPVPRAVGSVDANGTFTLNATTAQFSGCSIRCGLADDLGNFWAGGSNYGIIYLGSNSPTATVTTVSQSTRDLGFVNGNIYFTETGSGEDVMAFTGAPTTAATPVLLFSTAGTGTGTSSPKGFAFNSALTIAYVADNRTAATGGGIQRYNWNGSAWVHAYTLGNTLTSSQEVEDVAVNFSGTNPVLYTVTGESSGNYLITATDTGAGSTFSILETATTGDVFRGVTLAPTPH